MFPEVDRFFVFFAVMTILQYIGEMFTVFFLCLFYNPGLAQSVNMLAMTIEAMIGMGLLR